MTSDGEFFDEKVEEIKEKYQELGLYTPDRKKEKCDGWRFLYCPKSRIANNNGLLILGINPGAVYDDDKRYAPYCEENEYSYQWDKGCNDNIQRNIEILFKKISKMCGKSSKDIVDGSLTSNFIPFRSKGIDELPKKRKCVEFSLKLWTEIIEKNNFTVLICVGKKYYWDIRTIVEKQQKVCGSDPDLIPINWGKIKIEYSEIVKGNKKLIVVGLPHFSRISFIERPESEKAVDEICEKIAEYIK